MTYATVVEGLVLLGRLGDLSATTNPTRTEAETINTGVSAQIDNALASHGLTVPITGPSALVAYLKLVNMWGFAFMVLKARHPDSDGPVKDKSYAVYQKLYEDALARLYAGVGLDTASGATVLPGGYFVSYPDENVSLGDQAEPRFEAGKEW